MIATITERSDQKSFRLVYRGSSHKALPVVVGEPSEMYSYFLLRIVP